LSPSNLKAGLKTFNVHHVNCRAVKLVYANQEIKPYYIKDLKGKILILPDIKILQNVGRLPVRKLIMMNNY